MKKEKKTSVKFKTESFKVNDGIIKINIEVSDKGKFFFTLPYRVAQALNRDTREIYENSEADKLGYFLSDLMREYKELTTTHEFFIKYRFCFSNRIRKQLPNSVLNGKDDPMKRIGRIGSEYFPEDALSFILDWFAIEKVTHGKGINRTKLRPAKQDDIDRAEQKNEMGNYWLKYLKKPYEGIILCPDGQSYYWGDDEDHYFEIPLTRESYEFFIAFEENFVKMISGLFQFFNKDPLEIMAAITKSIEAGGSFKMLN